jgi:arginine decarboxylase
MIQPWPAQRHSPLTIHCVAGPPRTRTRGIQLPILLRFSDILRARIELLCSAFNGAIKEYGYTGQYRGVYPDQGQPEPHRRRGDHRVRPALPLGLEAGSKPELLAVSRTRGRRGADHLQRLQGRGVHRDRTARVEDGADTSSSSSRSSTELEQIASRRQARRCKPRIGIRAGCRARRRSLGGSRAATKSKFGLSAAEMVRR